MCRLPWPNRICVKAKRWRVGLRPAVRSLSKASQNGSMYHDPELATAV
jgi:hypothetical protein